VEYVSVALTRLFILVVRFLVNTLGCKAWIRQNRFLPPFSIDLAAYGIYLSYDNFWTVAAFGPLARNSKQECKSQNNSPLNKMQEKNYELGLGQAAAAAARTELRLRQQWRRWTEAAADG